MDPLLRSYRNTTYRVTGVSPSIDIRIVTPCPMLDALLLQRAVSCWAFITAWNPMSRPLPLAENRERAARLAAELGEKFTSLAGAGIGDAGDWAPEESLLVLGIAQADAIALALRYGQRAIVAGKHGDLPRLVECMEKD